MWEFLGEYHVNALVFLVVELVSSGLYGLWSARLVGALIDGDKASLLRTAPKVAVSYFAPDAYVLSSAGRLPGPILEIIVSVVAITALFTGLGIWMQVRRARRVGTASGPSAGE